MHPLHGPMSGGTVVTLQGHGLVSEFASAPALTDSLLSTAEQLGTAAQALSSLLTNAAVVAVSHQGLPCQLLTVNATVLTCRTAAVAEVGASASRWEVSQLPAALTQQPQSPFQQLLSIRTRDVLKSAALVTALVMSTAMSSLPIAPQLSL